MSLDIQEQILNRCSFVFEWGGGDSVVVVEEEKKFFVIPRWEDDHARKEGRRVSTEKSIQQNEQLNKRLRDSFFGQKKGRRH